MNEKNDSSIPAESLQKKILDLEMEKKDLLHRAKELDEEIFHLKSGKREN